MLLIQYILYELSIILCIPKKCTKLRQFKLNDYKYNRLKLEIIILLMAKY